MSNQMDIVVNDIIALIQKIKPELGNELIQSTSELGNLNITSLEFMKLLMELESRYSIEFSEEYLLIQTYGTIDGLARHIIDHSEENK